VIPNCYQPLPTISENELENLSGLESGLALGRIPADLYLPRYLDTLYTSNELEDTSQDKIIEKYRVLRIVDAVRGQFLVVTNSYTRGVQITYLYLALPQPQSPWTFQVFPRLMTTCR
jgi:hypothetical protein